MKFGSKRAIFGVIWGGFEGFGACLGVSHPTHPHLGEISQKKRVIGGFIERNAKQSQSDNKWDQSQVLDKCLFESPPHALVPVTANTRVAVVEQGCIAFHQGD